jgi:ATP synthase I subunit
MTDEPRAMDPRLRAALRVTAGAAAVLCAGAGLGFGARAALSVAAGGAIAAANLYLLIRLVSAVFRRSADQGALDGAGVSLGLATVIKMLALYGGVYLLGTSGVVGVFPLMVGLGALPIGIASAALVSDRAA